LKDQAGFFNSVEAPNLISAVRPAYPAPVYRRLKVFAFDPMLGRSPLHRITLNVPYEPLKPGPKGSRIQIIDFDGVCRTYYEPVNLDEDLLLLQDGLDPTESDPRFHQQMVYAVAMKVVENFDAALGRRLYFRGRRPLKLFPHAFYGANAFYDPRRFAVLFGYFPANQKNSGPNLPGQPVFSCLSHDIIAHEVTHAITHRLRKYFLEPTNHDVLAFHEAFSDIVAIFQHFSFPEILRQTIRDNQGDLRKNTPLIKLAEQFGYATGQGEALRSAVDKPDPRALESVFEPHERGSILVGAVFDAFFRTYQGRIQDLLRIASGGTGRLPRGSIHPDLVNRLSDEANSIALSTLRMCIRAFDYLPPVDVTFGDYLRSLVTADFELNPTDPNGLRLAMIEAFRERGIYPSGVSSFSEDELRWPRLEAGDHEMESERKIEKIIESLASELIQEASEFSRNSALDPLPAAIDSDADDHASPGVTPSITPRGAQLTSWARANTALLHLNPLHDIESVGFHPVFRVGRDGQLLFEIVVQFAQKDKTNARDFGGVALRGGSTIVVQANGKIRYVITKPLPAPNLPQDDQKRAQERVDRQTAFVNDIDARDTFHIWKDQVFQKQRLSRLANLARLHGRSRG
jgi:hypothetical protein